MKLKKNQNNGKKKLKKEFFTSSLDRISIKDILELKKQGVSILLVEQRVDAILSIADEILVIENGSIIFSADAKEVQNDNKKLYSLIGI